MFILSVFFSKTFLINFFYHVSCSSIQETYGKVFNQTSLDVDWYLIAGNHDYRGSVRAQIEYTKVLKRWQVCIYSIYLCHCKYYFIREF